MFVRENAIFNTWGVILREGRIRGFNLYQKLNFPTALTKAKFRVTYLYMFKFNKLTIVKKLNGRAGTAFKRYIPVACQLAIVVLS